jgi:hypothetical protein
MSKLFVQTVLLLAVIFQLLNQAQVAQALGFPYRQLEQRIPILGVTGRVGPDCRNRDAYDCVVCRAD